jgi:hypothetical protein
MSHRKSCMPSGPATNDLIPTLKGQIVVRFPDQESRIREVISFSACDRGLMGIMLESDGLLSMAPPGSENPPISFTDSLIPSCTSSRKLLRRDELMSCVMPIPSD